MDYWGTRFNEPTSNLTPSHTTTAATAANPQFRSRRRRHHHHHPSNKRVIRSALVHKAFAL